jgi:hypothetical protein
MPVTINDVEIMSDDGKFTENFSPAIFGEEYKDNKTLEGTSDFLTLGKRFLDTKAKLGEKLDGVIQKPKEGATDREKSEYKETLLKELGAPEKIEDYDIKVPEGLEIDENLLNGMTKLFFDKRAPKDLVQDIVAGYLALQKEYVDNFNAQQEAAFQEELKEYNTNHPGDSKKTKGVTAVKALLQFADEELTKLINESKIIDTPDDDAKWRSIGFSPRQRAIWENIGEKMKSDTPITDEGTTKKEETTTSTVAKKVYDHPTSVKDRQKRGVE